MITALEMEPGDMIEFLSDNQTDSGQNRETPGPDRWKIRSATWPGWANAMALQWGGRVSARALDGDTGGMV